MNTEVIQRWDSLFKRTLRFLMYHHHVLVEVLLGSEKFLLSINIVVVVEKLAKRQFT